MGEWYLYADAETRQILENSSRKILLVGGCFGYSNFGDILQLKGSVNFHKSMQRFSPIPVFAMEAISGPGYIAHAKKVYGVEGILFVSQRFFEAEQAGLFLQADFCGMDAMHLYGGGFLNEKWGSYVLSVAEFLLQNLEIRNYAISGQQVDAEFSERTADHINTFRPAFVGVRDYQSSRFLESQGIFPEFSFDDAYDQLALIASKVPRSSSEKALIHLNLSGYTGNVSKEQELVHALTVIGSNCQNGIVAFNAYNEKGFEVVDTIRSIALLENDFPFHDYVVVDGSALAFRGFIGNFETLNVGIAFSCSYHVALFMHLIGVPCYLNSNNSFYDQKRVALDCAESLEQFIKEKRVPDYSGRIEMRKTWLGKLKGYFLGVASGNSETKTVEFQQSGPSEHFQYKSDVIVALRDQLVAQNAYLAEVIKTKEWLEIQWREQSTRLEHLQSALPVKLLKKIGMVSDS